MRLLRVDNLVLEEYTDENALPSYAILSHTWLQKSQGEEVLFNDINDVAKASKKAGWRKIDFAVSEAIADGLEHVWIDTCCIDKSSSAELPEAINSMFRWYEKAQVCYVYLDDMKEPKEGQQINARMLCLYGLDVPITVAEKCSPTEALLELEPLRWFTRGWTLQELIAASSVRFYCTTGKSIGTLIDLIQPVSQITGIHLDLLGKTRPLSSFSIAQRMHWASRRVTTRSEDRAYSLLGIFDITLPIIYEEGGSAFQRLQEELLRQYSDHTIFARKLSLQNDQIPSDLPKPVNLLAT